MRNSRDPLASRFCGQYTSPLMLEISVSQFQCQHRAPLKALLSLSLSSHASLACPGASRHQVRFYSDATPPPIPKKRLARTVSLPDAAAPPLSPLSPLPSKPPQTFFHDQDPPIPSLSELSFDTPDEHLPHLFRNFEDQRVVFQGIQHRQTLFLQSVAQSIDAGILVQEGAPERDEHQYLPEDFLLHEGPTDIGGTVYYSLRSPKLPGRALALRVNTRLCWRNLSLFFFVCGVAGEEQSSFSFRSGFCEEFAGSPSPKKPHTWRE